MKHLQSPWRSAYIATFADEPRGGECLFCRIRRERDDVRNLVAWRGRTCFVVLNRFPYNSGHVLIVPNRHTASFETLRPSELAEMTAAVQRVMRTLGRLEKPHGYNLGANLGRVAGAGIDQHLHLHLVPRWNGDTNFMPVIANTNVVPEALRETAAKLRTELAR